MGILIFIPKRGPLRLSGSRARSVFPCKLNRDDDRSQHLRTCGSKFDGYVLCPRKAQYMVPSGVRVFMRARFDLRFPARGVAVRIGGGSLVCNRRGAMVESPGAGGEIRLAKLAIAG
jgi:hypothetical protein